jgi:uncharacterized protein YwgA
MAEKRIDNRKDVLLLLLYSPGKGKSVNEPIVGRTRLVKMLFLFKMEAMAHFRKGTEINDENFYEFFPWNFGPFSSQVYDDLTFFILRGFIEENPDSQEESLPESAEEWRHWLESGVESGAEDSEVTEYREEEFKLTDEGARWVLENLWPSLSDAQQQLLRQFKAKLAGAPLRALLKYVYTQYPNMTSQSKIKDEILGQYLD